jgi:hypothetical protein
MSGAMDKYDLDELDRRSERLRAEKQPPRFKPSKDPLSIVFPGVDNNAPPLERLEQLDQMITRSLQVRPISALTTPQS